MKPKLTAAVNDLHDLELALAAQYRSVGERHAADHDVYHICHTLAQQSYAHARQLESLAIDSAPRLDRALTSEVNPIVWASRTNHDTNGGGADGLVLLHDLRQLFLAASDCEIAWTIVGQCAKAARDEELEEIFIKSFDEVAAQLRWIKTKIKLAAPQAITVG